MSTQIDIELNGRKCGELRDIAIYNDECTGHFEMAKFDKTYVAEIFYDAHVSAANQRTSFDIIMTICNIKFTLKNVWLKNITGVIFYNHNFIMITNVGPFSPWPKDGRTFWKAEEFIGKEEYKLLRLLQ